MMEDKPKLVVSEDELSLVENNLLNRSQLQQLLKKTPEKYIKQRPAKGGGSWEYVTGGYVKKVLNLMFGWNFDFEIVNTQILEGEVIVLGKLTCRTPTAEIVKMQFGNKEIIYKKQNDADAKAGKPRVALSIGNDMKAAATDALKKCAAEIGIAADIYNKEEFREMIVEEITVEDLRELFEAKKESLKPDEIKNYERILTKNEKASFKRMQNELKSK
jgi:Rad52/22 family double-strand break repair protein